MILWIKRIVVGSLLLILSWIAYELASFPDLAKLRTENPTTTSMIELRLAEADSKGRKPSKRMEWQPIGRISRNLQRAVIAGEDSRFFQHNGFDWEAIQEAWDEAVKEGEKQAREEQGADSSSWAPFLPSFKRGASTITQQLVKNLYLSEERSFFRKGKEAAITFFIERELSKKRILEIYLNVIEWGDGIYGAEAASRHYFNKSAARLTASEAAYLAAMIPSPLNTFNPKKNPRRVARRQQILLRRMNQVRLDY